MKVCWKNLHLGVNEVSLEDELTCDLLLEVTVNLHLTVCTVAISMIEWKCELE
jgi:hypothetical protein